jgi:glucan endo-1,3-alpha-glucosidase
MLHDEVFVAAFTRSPGTVHVRSGSNAVFTQDVPAGVTMIRVPMAPGEQDFHFTTASGADVQGRSPQAVRASCIVSHHEAFEELS